MAKAKLAGKSGGSAIYAANLSRFVSTELSKLADAEKALAMAAYMKTTMPFYGVQKPDRVPIVKALKKDFAPQNIDEYLAGLEALWELPHREEKYIAINYAELFKKFICIESLPLYEKMIREGAWWDFVDPLAAWLVGAVYASNRQELKEQIEDWSCDDDFWIRRTALLVHQRHKADTDQEQLFDFCLKMAGEKEFFIRKAIGWSLREYSKVKPKEVRAFLKKHQGQLSPLSLREASKYVDPF